MTRDRYVTARTALRAGTGLPALLAGLILLSSHGAQAQGLVFTEAERTPLHCDREFTPADLAALTVPEPARPYTIAVSMPSFANPYVQALIYGAQLAADEAGITLQIGAGRGFMDPASQISQLENALARRPDAVLINPADPAAMALAIDDAIEAGVPVVEVGTLSLSDLATKVVQDDYIQGFSAGEALIGAMGDGGQGIVMGGPANASWSRGRVAGFLDAVAGSPQIVVNSVVSTDIDPQEGLTRFVNTAQAYPQVDWIYAVGSFLLSPQSIPEEFSNAVYVGGGVTNVTIEALENGTAAFIMPDFPISVGYAGVVLAVNLLNGTEQPQRNCIPSPMMTVEDLADPFWIDSNVLPADWVAPQ